MSDGLDHALSVRGLRVGYGPVEVVHGVDLDVRRGGLTAMIGPNGAGKSTVMWALMGKREVRAGSVVLDGVDVTRMPTHVRVRRGLSLVPEGRRLFPALTVRENLIVGAHRGGAQDRSAEGIDAAAAVFPAIAGLLPRQAASLSGGEQQMVAVARALMSRPRVLLLDEPSLGLAPLVVDAIYEAIVALRDRGISMLLVEQETERAIAVADRVCVLAAGEVLRAGSAAELAADPNLAAAYFGTDVPPHPVKLY